MKHIHINKNNSVLYGADENDWLATSCLHNSKNGFGYIPNIISHFAINSWTSDPEMLTSELISQIG